MTTKILRFALAACLAAGSGLSAMELQDQTGRKIQAEPIKLEGGQLTVSLADGKQHTIPLSRLAPASRKLVEEHFQPSAALTPSVPSEPPVESAKWSELFADGLVDKQGNDVSLESLEGKMVALYFSSASCGICNPVTENLKHLKEIAGSRIEVVSVCFEDSASEISSYMQSKEMSWPAVKWSDYDNREGTSSIRSLAAKFGGWGTPTLVILSESGELIDEEARAKVQSLPEERLKRLKSVNFKDDLREYREYMKKRGEELTDAAEQDYLEQTKQKVTDQIAESEAQLKASKAASEVTSQSSWPEIVAVFHQELRRKR